MPFCLNSKRFSFRLLPQISYVNTFYWFCKQKLSFSTNQFENFCQIDAFKNSEQNLVKFTKSFSISREIYVNENEPKTKQWFFREIDMTLKWFFFCFLSFLITYFFREIELTQVILTKFFLDLLNTSIKQNFSGKIKKTKEIISVMSKMLKRI